MSQFPLPANEPRRLPRWRRRSLTVPVAVIALMLGAILVPHPARADPVPATASQVVTVSAASSTTSRAELSAWQRNADGSWMRAFGPVDARVGSSGIGAASEGSKRTPAGTFALTESFGRAANPGTAMPYFVTDTFDWWDSNTASPTYNTHVRQATSPGGASENLYTTGAAYDYAVNIGYNLERTPGAGSAFFLHVGTGSSTAGCVSIDRSTLRSILGWLDPTQNPVIDIRVGPPWTPTQVWSVPWGDALFTSSAQWLSATQWQQLGTPAPISPPTETVRYPWAPGLYAVSYVPAGQVWQHLTITQWQRMGSPSPRAAGWVEGSMVLQYDADQRLFLRSPEGVRHHLTVDEWAATGHREPIAAGVGYHRLSWDDHIGQIGRVGALSYQEWLALGAPDPVTASRLPGDRFCLVGAGSDVRYDGPTWSGVVSAAQWAAAGSPAPGTC